MRSCQSARPGGDGKSIKYLCRTSRVTHRRSIFDFDGENDRRIVAAGDGDAEGGSVVLTDGKVIVLADDEGVNTIVEAVDGSGVVRTGTGRRRQHRCGLGCR